MKVESIAECSPLEHSAILLTCIKRQLVLEVSKGTKIRNRYKQVPHMTKDTDGKVTNF